MGAGSDSQSLCRASTRCDYPEARWTIRSDAPASFSSILNFTGPAKESTVLHAPTRRHRQVLHRCVQAGEKDKRIVKWDGNRNRRCIQPLLHNSMATALTDGDESVLFENSADFRARKNPESTQQVPQPGLRKRHGDFAWRFPMAMPFRRTASRLRSGSHAIPQSTHPRLRYRARGTTQRTRRPHAR